MKKEEAIEILNALAWVQGGPGREETITAISMAIEALQAEAVSEDTQIKTELAHIKTRLENVEKRLQGLILYGGVIR